MAFKPTFQLFTDLDTARAFGSINMDPIMRQKLAQDWAQLQLGQTEVADKFVLLDSEIATINSEIVTINAELVSLDGRLDTAEAEIDTLQADLTAHVDAQSAHGASGDIVGNLDYAQLAVGGVVWLAPAVGDAVDSATVPPAALGAAGAAYNQAYAQSQTDTINALITNVTDLQNALNAAIDIINSSLATERTAKQRAV